MEFEDVLAKVGDYDNFQKYLLLVFLIPSTFLTPLFTANQLFFVSLPDHWCNVPELFPFNLTVEEEQRLVRPKKDPSCSTYDLNYTSLLLTSENWTIPENTTKKDCEDGWTFDKTNYDFTAATQWNMFCEDEHYTSFILTMSSVGGTILTPIYGSLSDRFGRKTIFFLVILVSCITSFASILVTNFTAFVILRVINGGVMPSIFQIPCILLMEIVSPKVRARINGVGQSFWTGGMCLLPLIAWLTRDWVKFGLITSSIIILFFFYWPILLESPRWLLSVENYSEATKIMCKIAEKNGKEIKSEEILHDLQKLGEGLKKEKDVEKEEVNKFWQYPRLRKNFFIITYIWIAVVMSYHGLQINAYNLAGNEFMNFFLLAIAELPGCWLGWLFMEKLGRRWCSVSSLALIGISCLVPAVYPEWGVPASFVGKLGSSAAFVALYQQGSEIYPTSVRGFGMGLSSSCASAVNIGVPYMAYLNKYGEWIPFVIFALPALTASFLASFLPETLGENLPQTIEDAEHFGLKQKFFSFNRPEKDFPSAPRPSDVNIIFAENYTVTKL